ncbi:xanthine dehydrogenase family protein subunit M [Bradyrhizobium sp. AUGA SZCCT0160]|uniref:FAD binding domain-containing protein n=1 Tax=Bradyrhizobium sp. AUGA SZCCT0160 TaxID=2807662 RepID=UPI001BA86FA2|nr:xanthine dehydrogenase family protein subunit M [Bradyrhizobium sp. AUGA SZCCT0160]MBR1192695.1 xanthine dehydrogenase family protein subunit M [Bradyrhizobium sp. AUGA SZCCT0160]
MKARGFSYARPSTVMEALETFADSGEDASYIAGGQSLVPALALRLQAPQLLIDIVHIEALRGVELQGDWLRIGALTRHCEVLTNPLIARHAPLYHAAAPHVAHPAIRNRGTIGGSVAHSDPASEFPAMTLAMGAELELISRTRTRRVAADDFFIDLFQTAIEPGELLVAIHVPVIRTGHRWAFHELARRRGDYALVGCGVLAEFSDDLIEHISIVFFSVGNTPLRARQTEQILIGRRLDEAAVTAAQAVVGDDLDPPEDEHVPPDMKRHLARVLLGRLLGQIMRQDS